MCVCACVCIYNLYMIIYIYYIYFGCDGIFVPAILLFVMIFLKFSFSVMGRALGFVLVLYSLPTVAASHRSG